MSTSTTTKPSSQTRKRCKAIGKGALFLLFTFSFILSHATTIEFTTSKWEIDAKKLSSIEKNWVTNNRLYALQGSETGKAFISTCAGSLQSSPKRLKDGKFLAVSNLSTGDALCFEVPITALEKGSKVDFMLTLQPLSPLAPKYWIFEYWDNNKWNTVKKDLQIATEDPSLQYSFYLNHRSSAHYTSFVQSFKLSKSLNNTHLKMRCRVVGNLNCKGECLLPDTTASVAFQTTYYQACCINTYQGIPEKDHIKIGVLGNSFTYYYGAAFMLKEMAQTQGHGMTMRVSLKGGQTFGEHMELPLSQSVINEKGYNYTILQDQSCQHAYYWSDSTAYKYVLDNAILLTNKFRAGSPKVKNIIENTWAYANKDDKYMDYGNYNAFDLHLQKGAEYLCHHSGSWESPVGIAYQKARQAGITDLYHTDNKHPNRNGAYLIACVNYLLIYGKPFNDNIPDCLVDHSTAQKLRSIAEEVVLKNIQQWRNP